MVESPPGNHTPGWSAATFPGNHTAGAADSAAADVVAAVCARLPRLGRRDLALVGRAWEKGPPEEEVGLEPFAPPGYLDGSGTEARR